MREDATFFSSSVTHFGREYSPKRSVNLLTWTTNKRFTRASESPRRNEISSVTRGRRPIVVLEWVQTVRTLKFARNYVTNETLFRPKRVFTFVGHPDFVPKVNDGRYAEETGPSRIE